MKKFLLGAVAAATMMVPALAADMRAPVMKAPPMPVQHSWTGCYVAGGGGYGMWNQEITNLSGGVPFTPQTTGGGKGWFGTAGGGCDLQVSGNWVIGIFGDYDFADIKGTPSGFDLTLIGNEKMRSAWSVGGRIGYLITPTVLTFVSGGFTEARFSAVDLLSPSIPPVPVGINVVGHTYSGWFLGSGFEYNLGFLPGLFWRTEYRYASYGTDNVPIVVTATGAPSGLSIDSQKFTQTIRSELVWRWNWGR